MSIDATLTAALDQFKTSGRIVVVGASLAGLRAAEALREEGFRGRLTIIGDEPHEPYDRPPLSKQVLLGSVPADHTKLPRRRPIDADWRLGVAATGLDRAAKQVRLANGEQVRYDRLLIATGVRARPWFNPAEAALDGVFCIRTCDDATGLRERLAAGPRRVLIIGAGFIGSEVASICRELDLAVTVCRDGRGAARRCARRRHRPDRRRDAARARRRPAHRRLGDVARRRRERHVCSSATPVRRHHARRGRGRGRRSARSATSSGWRAPGLPPARSGASDATPAAAPSTSTAWSTDSIYVAGRRRARAPRAVRVPVPRDGALGQRRARRRGRGPQHGEPRARPPPASAAARLLVGPVRRQHQVGRRAPLRRRDRLHPGLARSHAASPPPTGAGAGSSAPSPSITASGWSYYAGLIEQLGAVPAAPAGLRSARRHDADPGRVPGPGRRRRRCPRSS